MASDIAGLKFFKHVRPLLDTLHRVGANRDTAGNRKLHYDQYGVLVLMWMFNPVIDSLRGLQQASNLKEIQKKFGVSRASLGSLSESVTIFDPEPLKQIAATLATQIPNGDPSRFDQIGHQLTAWTEVFSKRLYELLHCHGCLPKATAPAVVEGSMATACIPTLKSCEAYPSESMRRQPNLREKMTRSLFWPVS